MKVKVTHNSVELKLTLEDTERLQTMISHVESSITATEFIQDRAKILNKKLRDAREAANKLNWMDGM